MSQMNIEALANFAATTLATYGTLDKLLLHTSLTESESKANFTSTQADAFVARYELVDQRPNQLSGFSAALFWDKIDQKHVLAIRGTEMNLLGIPTDLISADLVGIGVTGYANEQAADLYRYWKALTTAQGETVSYTTEELVHLFMLDSGAIASPLEIITSAAFIAYSEIFEPDTGLGYIDADEIITVTGHSLGGHLAMLFARLFPENTDQVIALNGPGLFSWGDGRLVQAGFSVPENYDDKIIRLNADGDLINLLGDVQPGIHIDFMQEVSSAASNHSSVNGVALYFSDLQGAGYRHRIESGAGSKAPTTN